MNLFRILALAACISLLAACGESQGPSAGAASARSSLRTALDAAARGAPPLPAAAVPLSLTVVGVDDTTAANQLLDHAERTYPELFAGHPATGVYEGYTYRYYANSGIYLGVRDGLVFVMGGPFGSQPLPVGPLAQFITPSTIANVAGCAASPTSYALYSTPMPTVGKQAALSVAGCNGAIRSPQWRQTSGPSLELLADRAQTLSIEPAAAGTYGFTLSFIDADGVPRTENLQLAVTDAAPSPERLTLRTSHSVRMGGKVSVRAWPTLAEGETVDTIQWQQLDGPAVTLDTTDPRLALFTAPSVPRDTLIRLRATLRTGSGRVDTDEMVVLVERHVQSPASDRDAMWAGDHVPRVYAYRPGSRYAGVLQGCVYDTALAFGSRFNLCTLSRLPFLARPAVGVIPTIDEVMDRVLVSHDWLGRNFETFLRTQDPQGDFRRMLSSVTAVVLSTHVRPSFYYPGTGAIYLDADSFWLTPAERDTINEAPDFRGEFDDGLQYANLWRYVQDGKSLFAFFDPELRVARVPLDIRNEAAWLMYHELGHALDFLPPGTYATLNSRVSAWENIAGRYVDGRLTSDTVPAQFPLQSDILRGLGQVKFQGATADIEQRSYTPLQVAEFFGADLATDEYSYSTSREDVAMTLEEFLMSHRLGIARDVAFTDPIPADATSSSMIVRWGQRGRIGEPALAPRAQAIVRELAPWVDAGEVERLPAPIALRSGESWAANLSPSAAASRGPSMAAQKAQKAQFRKELRRMLHHRHAAGKRLPPLPASLSQAPARP